MEKPKARPQELSIGMQRWIAFYREAQRVYDTYVKPAEEREKKEKAA